MSCGRSSVLLIGAVDRRRIHLLTMALNGTYVVQNPDRECDQWLRQRLAERGQAVFDLGRNSRMHLSQYQPITLKLSQRARQHLLGDSADHPFELIEPSGLLNQHDDGQDRPFVAHTPKYVVHLLACRKGARLIGRGRYKHLTRP
jgi:hypothetical protein